MGSIIFTILSESKFGKWEKGFFEWNCIVKWVTFSASFSWLRDILLENLKLQDKLQIWSCELFIFGSKFLFFGTFLWRFSQCNFKIFRRQPTMVADIFPQLPSLPLPFTLSLKMTSNWNLFLESLIPKRWTKWIAKRCPYALRRFLMSLKPERCTEKLLRGSHIHIVMLLISVRTKRCVKELL